MGNISNPVILPTPPIVEVPGIIYANSTVAVTAGAAYFAPVEIFAPVTITQMRTAISGSPTGNVDMGVYGSTGTNKAPNNLLGHTGAIASASGTFTQNLTANLTLFPGLYWLSILDTVADTFFVKGTVGTSMDAIYRTSATNLATLPATAGTLINTNLLINMVALISGGFS